MDAITEVGDYHASNNVFVKRNHQKILYMKAAIKFSKLQKELDGNLKNQ